VAPSACSFAAAATMANTTVRGATAIHGQNPQVGRIDRPHRTNAYATFQYLVETVIRSRIYEAPFWKEHCFALTGTSSPSCVSHTGLTRSRVCSRDPY
jgi:hypothetical protein